MPIKYIDVAIVAMVPKGSRGNPVGEATGCTTVVMTVAERQGMLDRLQTGIGQVMDKSHEIYLKPHTLKPDAAKPDRDDEVDMEYIIRVSTNEFFFYTQEPLILKEFTALQNKIAEKAKLLPPGIQLVLGSFAVKTADNSVANVTPHITCGTSPSFHFLVKNVTSSIDVHYIVANPDNEFAQGFAHAEDLDPFDASTPELVMPSIIVDGAICPFRFDNVVISKTPKGNLVITVVDICLDHDNGVGKANLLELIMKNPDYVDLPVSHMVISNVIDLNTLFCVGLTMHVDPLNSRLGCKKEVAQGMEVITQAYFGKGSMKLFEVAPTLCPKMAQIQLKTLKQLSFGGDKDTLMKEYIQQKVVEYRSATSEQKQRWVDEMDNLITAQMMSSDLKNIRETIVALKKESGFFTMGYKKKAHDIEDVMGTVPIVARGHLLKLNPGNVIARLEANGLKLSSNPKEKPSPETKDIEVEAVKGYKS